MRVDFYDFFCIILYVFVLLVLITFLLFVGVTIHCSVFHNRLEKVEINENFTIDDKNDPIDVVYTWVDSKDPSWIEKKKKALGEITSHGSIDNSNKRWINTKESHEEISLSIESVRKYLPWIRNIFVVTQRPQKLPQNIIDKFNVIHIHHDQIVKSQHHLPVFSSHAIETNIHRIDGLANKFIYFNDDMYINRHMKRSDFFYYDLPIFRYYKYFTFYVYYISKIFSIDEKFVKSLVYCRNLCENNNFYLLPCIHHATPITKEIMFDAESMFAKDWELTSSKSFRSSTDIVPIYISLSLAFRNKKVVILKNDPIKHTLMNHYIYAPFFHNSSHLICVNYMRKNKTELLRKQILSEKETQPASQQVSSLH